MLQLWPTQTPCQGLQETSMTEERSCSNGYNSSAWLPELNSLLWQQLFCPHEQQRWSWMVATVTKRRSEWLWHNRSAEGISYPRESHQEWPGQDWRNWYSQYSERRHCRSQQSRWSHLDALGFECGPKWSQWLGSWHEAQAELWAPQQCMHQDATTDT